MNTLSNHWVDRAVELRSKVNSKAKSSRPQATPGRKRRRPRRPAPKLLSRLGGLVAATYLRLWMQTLDYKAFYYDLSTDPVASDFRGPVIFIFWHEYIPFLLNIRRHQGVSILLSKHQDAEWLSQAARHLGFGAIRGSTNRGGVVALREILRSSSGLNLGITPDGPRGPRRQLAAGCIFVASRLGLPLVPLGLGYERPWRIRKAWDQFAVPRPFSRARAVAGPPIYVPSDADRAQLETYRLRVESILNELTQRAEAWADSGQRWRGQYSIYPGTRIPGPQ